MERGQAKHVTPDRATWRGGRAGKGASQEAQGALQGAWKSKAAPSFTWQAAGILRQQVLIGIEEACVGDHNGAIDVHQLLTLLHGDACRHKSVAELLCTSRGRERPRFHTDRSQPTLHRLRPGHPAHLRSSRRAPGKTAKQVKHSRALSAYPRGRVRTYPPWLSPRAMWAPSSVAKPYNLHTNRIKAPGRQPIPPESQALLHRCQTSISKTL